jgi:hypothetical protein
VWQATGHSAADRRPLFLLWDEADGGTAGGQQARRTIEGFVRQ